MGGFFLFGKGFFQHCADAVAKLVGLECGGLLCGDHAAEAKRDVCRTPGEILEDLIAALHGADKHGYFCALGCLEAAVAEGEHRCASAARTFGIDTEGSASFFEALCNGEDRAECFAVILAVDREEAASAEVRRDQRNLENARLCHEIDDALRKGADDKDGVEAGAVVTGKEEGLLRNKLEVFSMDADAEQNRQNTHGVDEQETVQLGVGGMLFFAAVGKNAENQQENDIEKNYTHGAEQCEEKQQTDQRKTGIAGAQTDDQRCDQTEQKKDEQEHGAETSIRWFYGAIIAYYSENT